MKDYFTIEELTASAVAKSKGIDNTPNQQTIDRLGVLKATILNPLRERYGKPIYITSGYRCRELNTVLGGSKNSDHLYGMAADITTGNIIENRKLFQILARDFRFKQLILEYGGKWIHVSYGNKNEILSYDGKKYTKLDRELADFSMDVLIESKGIRGSYNHLLNSVKDLSKEEEKDNKNA